jgi:3',5'-cyclic-AMP phosphodiesterase
MSRPAGTLRAVPTAKTLEAVISEARHRFPSPDKIVWTGDLSDEHSVGGYELLKQLIGEWTEISVLIPGNHDDRANLRSVFDQLPGQPDEEVCFRTEVGDWSLIGLDTQIPGEVSGGLSGAMIHQLNVWLSEDRKRPTLIFLHHPPGPVGSAWIDQFRLRNPEPLSSALARAPGVKGIFCGHVHHVFEGEFAGVPMYTAPATSFQFMPGVAEFQLDLVSPGFRSIRLDDDQFATEVIRLPRLEFVPDETQP